MGVSEMKSYYMSVCVCSSKTLVDDASEHDLGDVGC